MGASCSFAIIVVPIPILYISTAHSVFYIVGQRGCNRTVLITFICGICGGFSTPRWSVGRRSARAYGAIAVSSTVCVYYGVGSRAFDITGEIRSRVCAGIG